MQAQLLDGRTTSKTMLDEVAIGVAEFVETYGRAPALATVLVGEDPASRTYVRMKVNKCEQVGIISRRIDMPESTTTEDLVQVISGLSADPAIDGILLQHPVPDGVNERAAFEAIDPTKDVDGVTRASFAAMSFSDPGFSSATPGGILALLDAYRIPLSGAHAVVVGRSAILGKPVGMLLLERNATVTFCHSRTVDLEAQIRTADLVVAAAGVPDLIKGEWIQPGAVVVDAGYVDNRGDIEFGAASKRAAWITPVPGGVGPMTIATLLAQTLLAAQRRSHAR